MTSPIIDPSSERLAAGGDGRQDAGAHGNPGAEDGEHDHPRGSARPLVDKHGRRLHARRGPGGWESRAANRDRRAISWQQALAGSALLGTGALLLWRSRQQAADHNHDAGYRDSLRSIRRDARESWHKPQDRVAQASQTVREGAQEAARNLSAGANQLADTARESAQSLGVEALRRYEASSEYAARQYDEIRSRAETLLHDQPLVVGAIGMAVGAAIGGLAPSTRPENRWLGGIRDDVLDQASLAARQRMESLRDQAADALEASKDSASGGAEAGAAGAGKSDSSYAGGSNHA